MKILINDYCGYPFQIDLVNELIDRGHKVCVSFTSSSGGPKAFTPQNNNNSQFIDIQLSKVEKHNFFKRWFQESKYGEEVIEVIRNYNPQLVISANTPLAAQRQIINHCHKNKIKFVFWLQDIISIAVYSILGEKYGKIGQLIGYIFKQLEIKALKKSNHIIAIADEFKSVIKKWGINEQNISVIPNWAPVEKFPIYPKVNSFSKRIGIENKFVVLYSGTLGLKHDPLIITKTAKKLFNQQDIIFVVVAEGIGMELLKAEKEKFSLNNLIILPFQPIELLPKVLSSGDLLLVLLEPKAGDFSVPSKVWSGYCAKRPSILVVPKENLSAKITLENNAGIVISDEKNKDISKYILELKSNDILRNKMGNNARKYAEEHFQIDKITNRFEEIIKRLND